MDTPSIIEAFRGATRDEILGLIDRLSPEDLLALADALPAVGGGGGDAPTPSYPWQQTPEGQWYGWAIVGGRGIGKTLGAAAWCDQQAQHFPGIRFGIIAPTLADARATCIEGETGLQAVNPDVDFNRSTYEGRWSNGSKFRCFGAYTPQDRRRLRGPQWHRAWLEEFAAWRQLDEQPRDDEPDSWQHITMALRLGADPRFVMGSTPKRRRRYREVIARPDVVVTRGTTAEATGLAAVVRDRLFEMFSGTRLGRQELGGEELEDVEGAQWSEATLETHRVNAHPPLHRVTVGVDPSGSRSTGMTGIVAAGSSRQRWPHPVTGRLIRHGYILADQSVSAAPEVWAQQAVDLYHDLEADHIVAEINYGGEMVESVIRTVDPTVPVEVIHASRGKKIRAEPIAGLSAQGLLHLVGRLPRLEDELTTWVDDESPWSPNRLDAMVWAATDLLPDLGGRQETSTKTPKGSISGSRPSAYVTTRSQIRR